MKEVTELQRELQDSAKGKQKSIPQHWAESGNLAAFNGLKTEPYITVPVDLNLIFIGFSGDGHHRLVLNEDELRPWFEHLEHRMEHVLVPVRQASDADEGDGPRRPGTGVYYHYRFHVVDVHPDVGALVESVVWDNARPVSPWAETAVAWTAQDMHQVDPAPLQDLLGDLVGALRLNRTAFTLFLLNPKLPHPDFNYGYRHGFSSDELLRLHLNATLLDILLDREPIRPPLRLTQQQIDDVHALHEDLERRAGRLGEAEAAAAAAMKDPRAKLGEQVEDLARQAGDGAGRHGGVVHPPKGARGGTATPRGRPKYSDMRNLSKVWAAMYKQALHELSYWQRHPTEEAADFDEDDEEAHRAYVTEMKRRVGTEVSGTLPPDMLFEVLATRMLQAKKTSPEGAYVRRAIEDRHLHEDCLVDTWVADERFAWVDFSAGPFEWGPIVGGKGVRTRDSLPDLSALETAATDFTAGGKWKDRAYVERVHQDLRQHGMEKLKEEKTLLLAFLNRNCDPFAGSGGEQANGEGVGSTCQELRHKLSTVEAFLRSHTRVEDKDEATLAHLSFITGGPHEGANLSAVRRAALARVGALIEGTQRQLITPPIADISAPYRAQVYFHTYLVANHETYQPDAPEHFDFDRFKAALETLRLPRQRFHHVLHKYSLSEDPALAVALANSMRSAAVASLKVDGKFVSTKRMYLDSQVLQRHLQLLHDKFVSAEEEQDAEKLASSIVDDAPVHRRDVPIFIFSMDVPMPVFIDKHYQARALEDMVVAVQSDELEWESHIACNGGAVMWNLRNPLKSVLAATAQHLAGLLPTHIAFDEARNKVSQDWLWSVGCGPLSHTSAFLNWKSQGFPKAQVDASQRAQVVSILQEALAAANEGVATLRRTTTSPDNRALAMAAPNDRLVQLHVAAKLAWGKAVVEVGRLDFDAAIPHAHAAARSAKAFLDLAQHSEKLLVLSACLHPVHNAPFDYGMVLAVGAALLAVVIYHLCSRGSAEKAKIN